MARIIILAFARNFQNIYYIFYSASGFKFWMIMYIIILFYFYLPKQRIYVKYFYIKKSNNFLNIYYFDDCQIYYFKLTKKPRFFCPNSSTKRKIGKNVYNSVSTSLKFLFKHTIQSLHACLVKYILLYRFD